MWEAAGGGGGEGGARDTESKTRTHGHDYAQVHCVSLISAHAILLADRYKKQNGRINNVNNIGNYLSKRGRSDFQKRLHARRPPASNFEWYTAPSLPSAKGANGVYRIPSNRKNLRRTAIATSNSVEKQQN